MDLERSYRDLFIGITDCDEENNGNGVLRNETVVPTVKSSIHNQDRDLLTDRI
jgi:hypothetical protein